MWLSILTGIIVVLLLSACGYVDREIAKVTGDPSKTCVNGVIYLQFTSGAALLVDTDGKPVA